MIERGEMMKTGIRLMQRDMEELLFRYVGTRRAAEILGVHPHTVRSYIRDRKLPAIRKNGKYLVSQDDLGDLARRRGCPDGVR